MADATSQARAALVAKFRSIAAERLERLNGAFVQLETDPENEALATLLMREIHTLKGEAKLMGFADINVVAHKTEDLLLLAKEQHFRVPVDLANTILRSFDLISHLLRKQVGGEQVPVDLGAFLGEADQQLRAAAPHAGRAPAPAAPVGPRPPPPSLELVAETSIRIEVKKIDAVIDVVADLLRFQLESEHLLRERGRASRAWGAEMTRLRAQSGRHSRPELASREQLTQIIEELSQTVGRLTGVDRALDAVTLGRQENVSRTRDRVEEIERRVRELRLLPLSTLLDRYGRAVRDLAVEQAKAVEISVSGGEIEIDKRVLDQIGEPLLHLVRNAVDHGIETPEERRAAGKPERGSVRFVASQAGAHVELALSDDGRGLAPDEIRRAAIARGLLSAGEAERLTQEELFGLVFAPNFSTRAQATDVSGRGIGLHAARQRVEALGGTLRVLSQPGHGTTVTLRVPVSVALMKAMVFEVAGVDFAVPSTAVSVVLEPREGRAVHAGGGLALALEEELLPLRDLGRLLGLTDDRADSASARVVVLQSGPRRLALRVGTVIGERDLVHRPPDPFLTGLTWLDGSSVIEHERPILVLSVPALVNQAAAQPPHSPTAAEPTPTPGRCILLVEDSELTRDMLESTLREAGYRVLEAVNGKEALACLDRQRPDLVITDLEMPVLDGFELIRRIRATPGLVDLPVVVLSNRGEDEDKRRAAEVGADAYLVKRAFGSKTLLESLGRFFAEED